LLDEKKIEYRYREYTREPLSEKEIRDVLRKLGLHAKDVLRKNDRFTGAEPENELIAAMAGQPTLLQRPIGVLGERAVVGRPPERLLELAGDR
jgi:arsenate reductase